MGESALEAWCCQHEGRGCHGHMYSGKYKATPPTVQKSQTKVATVWEAVTFCGVIFILCVLMNLISFKLHRRGHRSTSVRATMVTNSYKQVAVEKSKALLLEEKDPCE